MYNTQLYNNIINNNYNTIVTMSTIAFHITFEELL